MNPEADKTLSPASQEPSPPSAPRTAGFPSPADGMSRLGRHIARLLTQVRAQGLNDVELARARS